MAIPPLLGVPGNGLASRLRSIGRRGLIGLAVSAVLGLIFVLGSILPGSTLPLTWFVPVRDIASIITMAVALFLCASDVRIRRHSRALPIVITSIILISLWLAHMVTFPNVIPIHLPLVTGQTTGYIFHAAHLATPILLSLVLLTRGHPLPRPGLALTRASGLALAISLACIAAAVLAPRILPPTIVDGKFTELNTALLILPFFAVGFAAAVYRRGAHGDRYIESGVIAAFILVAIETLTFLFARARYDGFWYVGNALVFLPDAALLAGVLGLYATARREADIHLRLMSHFKESQQRLQIIIDTSPSAVISADDGGFVTGWNSQAEAVFGWSHDEAVGRLLAETVIPKKYREAHQRGLEKYAQTGDGRIIGKTVELTGLHRDGHEFPIELSVSATGRVGNQLQLVAFVTDISERRMAERLRNVQFAVTRPLANAATWAEAAPQVLQGICENLGWSLGEIWNVDRVANVLRWEYGWHKPGRELQAFEAASREVTFARGVGLLGRVWATGRATSIQDVSGDRDASRMAAAARAGLHGKFGFAITNGRKVTGVIALFSSQAQAPDRATLRIMADLGSQIGQFIERRRAEDELRSSGERIRAVLDNVADGIVSVDDRLVIRSYNPAAERLFGYSAEEVIGKEFGLLIAEPYRTELKPQLRSYLQPQKREALLGSHEADGQRKDGSTFPMEFNVGRLGAGRLLVGSLRDVSERKAETEALQHRALHDALTGLPNRTFLRERLEEAVRVGEREMKPCAVLLMDMDGFKGVNDSLGHQAGDQLLQQVGGRMRDVLRKADMVARYGGDEFAVVPWGATDVPRAVLIAEKILQAIQQPYTIEGSPVNVSISVGIAVYPQHAEDGEALMRRADVAMYAAKRAKSGYSVYAAGQEDDVVPGVPLIGKLRYAIDQFELLLHYQPIVSSVDGATAKVEALVRWGHPSHGLLPPDDFIPSAEQSDLIKPLTAWVLNEALGQVHAWARAGIETGVSVNLSARNLLDRELPDAVAELLRTWQVPPAKLSLEITERSIIASEAEDTLARLHALGVQISVDDFGTGYSSLAYLKRLPVNEIKIDKSFVQDMVTNRDGAAIVRSTIDLGHNLGLKVVAEGVEDAATADLLREFGCDFIQGYYISRPAAAAPLGPWLRSRASHLKTVTITSGTNALTA